MKKKSQPIKHPQVPTSGEFREWADSIPRNVLDIWREALSNLRAMSADVWNGVRFFLTVNAAVLAGIVALYRTEHLQIPTNPAIAFLAIIGMAVTVVARGIFFRQRFYYVQMLARKILLDKELGFRDHKVGALDLSFPWSVDDKSIELLQTKPDDWIQDQLLPKSSIRRRLLHTYDGLLIVYTVIFLLTMTGIYLQYMHVGICT